MDWRGWGVVLALLSACAVEETPQALPAEPSVSHIHGGDDALPCEWPTVVALLDLQGRAGCSGTLIHPEFVLTAAHCVSEHTPTTAVLGEDIDAPADARSVKWCKKHPAHNATQGPAVDLAVCALVSPIADVQIVPPLQGCERDALRQGAATLIAGFGHTQGWVEDGELVDGEGGGLKRSIPQSVYELRDSQEEVDVVAIGSPGGGCHGDSGGAGFIQLSDGTWRLFGVAETLFDPEVVPQPLPDDANGACGTGTTYSLVSERIPWIEHTTGRDVTPCFDSLGRADPGPQCGALPLQPGHGHGTWAQSCEGPLGGELRCEPHPEPPDDGSSTGDEEDGEESGSGTGWASSGEGPQAAEDQPDELPQGKSEVSSGTRAVDGGSCNVGGGHFGWMLALLLFIRRRRS